MDTHNFVPSEQLASDLENLRMQLGQGSIQRAYAALIGEMSGLRARFSATYGERTVSGLYQGCFDMTYFAVSPPSLKARDLKLAVVFNYEAFRFEVWLAARNRSVQRRYWELLRDSGWSMYRLVEPATGIDAIVEYVVTEDIDLNDPDRFPARMEEAVARLRDDVERFLDTHEQAR